MELIAWVEAESRNKLPQFGGGVNERLISLLLKDFESLINVTNDVSHQI
jgi:hypothetical protein